MNYQGMISIKVLVYSAFPLLSILKLVDLSLLRRLIWMLSLCMIIDIALYHGNICSIYVQI